MAFSTYEDVHEVSREKPPCHLLSDELLAALDARYERVKDIPAQSAKIDYMPIRSETLKHLASDDFSLGELKVLLVLLRKRSGEYIDMTQFQELTGLAKSAIGKALSSLTARQIIFLGVGLQSGSPAMYHINNLQSWRPRLEGQEKEAKETPTLKKVTDPRIKVAMDYYFDSFQAKFKQAPVINGAKDGSILKRLLAELELDRVKELMDIFFQTDDEFIIGSGYGLGVFSATINKLITQAVKTTGPSAAPDWAKDKK